MSLERTVYLDNSVIGREEHWQDIRAALAPGRGYRLAFSEWGLYEIAGHGDRDAVIRRARFVESLNPLWIVERLHAQKMEVRSFLWRNFYRAPVESVQYLKRHLSEVLYFHSPEKVPIGWRPEQYALNFFDHPDLIQEVHDGKPIGRRALEKLQEVGTDAQRAAARAMNEPWIKLALPIRGPDDRQVFYEERSKLLSFCLDNAKQFFRECPTMGIEDVLMGLRSGDAGRVVEDNDAPDLQHAVAGLSACDHFVTRDGFLFECAKGARKRLPGVPVASPWLGIDNLP